MTRRYVFKKKKNPPFLPRKKNEDPFEIETYFTENILRPKIRNLPWGFKKPLSLGENFTFYSKCINHLIPKHPV